MTSKLEVYNGCLLKLGSPPLQNLTDSTPSKLALDYVYDACVVYCLEQADWPFARRTVKIDASTDVTPEFGYSKAFAIPDDFILLSAISASATLDDPLLNYTKEAGFFFADVDPLYLTYVSSGASYGYDLGDWPEAFADYVEYYLAVKAGKHIHQSDNDLEILKRDMKHARSHAIANFGRQLPSKAFPAGSWTRSRQGTRRAYRGRDY